MKNSTPTFDYTLTIPMLTGTATLIVKESSFVLSEKSLYGAGTTRHTSSVSVTYKASKNAPVVEILNSSNQEKQNIFKVGDDYIEKDKKAVDYINKMVSLYIMNASDDD